MPHQENTVHFHWSISAQIRLSSDLLDETSARELYSGEITYESDIKIDVCLK